MLWCMRFWPPNKRILCIGSWQELLASTRTFDFPKLIKTPHDLSLGCPAQYVPMFYRVQRPVLRMAVADRDSIARLRNLLLDFHSACYELKRDQQALSLLRCAMQRCNLKGAPTRETLLELEVGLQSLKPALHQDCFAIWPCIMPGKVVAGNCCLPGSIVTIA